MRKSVPNASAAAAVCAAALFLSGGGASASPILLEAEAFAQKGGWVVDQQFMDQMGSPYLLAHGLGKPVADASTSFECAPGKYRVLVRSRDWISPHGPGRFAVSVNDQRIKAEFGRYDDSRWDWRDGGWADLKSGGNVIALTDLTGFGARCDAVLLVSESEFGRFVPPNDSGFGWRRELLRLPARPTDGGRYGFIVVGGGYAGVCAAVSAARQGVKTLIIQDRPVFGGNASSEVRVGPIGGLGNPPYPRNSDVSYELIALSRAKGETSGGLRPPPDDSKIHKWLLAESNLTVRVSTRAVAVEKNEGGALTAVIGRGIEDGVETRFEGMMFADCTGDAWLAAAAGARVRSKPETREETGESLAPDGGAKGGGYGSTVFWRTSWTNHAAAFPPQPWMLPILDDEGYATVPRYPVEGDFPFAGGWNWEVGVYDDPIENGEAMRDHAWRAAYSMWSHLKNSSTNKLKYAKADFSWMGYILGKRAARRIVGDYTLTQQDLVERRRHPDGCVTTTWFLDMHFPHPVSSKSFPGAEFRSLAYDDPQFDKLTGGKCVGKYISFKPYPIPYRCFYSADVPNLFMAGKDVSATHVAMASLRVENTTGTMGTMVGRAVSLCLKNGWSPRELGAAHFGELDRLLKDPGRRSDLSVKGQRIHEKRETFWKNVRWHFIRFGVWVKGLLRSFLGLFS